VTALAVASMGMLVLIAALDAVTAAAVADSEMMVFSALADDVTALDEAESTAAGEPVTMSDR
jgi:hypothetical protein